MGNPINAGTGNKFESAVDYEGAGHTGLSLTRYYNSMDTESSPFGAKWRSTWHRKATQSNASTVKVTREDGRVDTFTFNGSAWVSDPDVQSRLTGSASSGWQLVREDDSTESYAADGRLLSVTTRPGLVTTLAYDASNRLASVTGPFGHAMSFAYDASNRVAAVTLPDGKTVIYGYDANNNLVSVTYPDSKSRRYVYENATFPNAMTGIVDEKGVRFATYAYDAKGRTVSSEHANGAGRVAIDYASATTSTVTDARGNQSAYDLTKIFDVIRPASMTKNCCGGADYAYDSNGFLASRTDFNGNVTTYVHNARGLETSRTDASGTAQARTINTEWHSTLRLPTKITEPNRVTTFAYDANGNMVQKAVVETGGKIRTWTYTYNAKGQVLTVNGPRTDASDITKYAYDTKGNLTSVTDALGMITKITSYDPNGRPLIVVDPNGLTTKFAYDARGRVVSLTEGTEKTSYAYDAAGNLTKATLPDGSYLAYVYDDAHRLTSVMDALGNRKVFTLDGEGNRTKEEVFDAHGSLQETRTRVFDQVNRLHQVIGATGQTTVIEHDANGNITSVTDPLGNVAMNGYDALNRLIQSTNPDTGIVRYAYNTDDKVTKVTDPRNLATAYTLNGLGDLTAIKSPDSGSTTNVYDAAGNLTATTDARGKKTIYTYDALNRLKTEKYADGRTVTYTYDNATNAKGRLTKIADPSGNTVFTYDQHGRETKRVQTIGTLVFTTSRTYDAYGRPSSITYPSGQKATMNYDVVSGKPSAILVNGKRLVSNIHYRPFGPVAGWLAGNGQGHERAFDLDGRLSGVEAGSSYLWLTYDDAGRITGQQEDLFSSKDYAYDSMSRILTASGGAMERSYLYDANGNRLLQETETGVTNYFYAAASNRLLSATGEKAQTNSFDAAGNLLKDGMATFTVDASGRVNSAKVNSVTTTYTHNALGQRVSKKNASGTPFQNFVYDRNGELLGAYNQSKASIEETVWLEGMPIGVIKSGVLYHVTPGHLKQPHHITNSVGKRVWQWNTDPFGNGSPNQNPQGAGTFTYSLRFPGQVYDSETGLHYNYYRTYDPETGRYTQVDPIGLNGGINPYVYVGGNPVSGVDLFGLKAYFVNRDLNLPLIINKSAEPRWDFLTHTFVVTTNNDGTISHTYSWGNEANRNGWNLDEPLDIATAKDAIKEKLAEPIVDNVIGPFLLDENSLDPFIDEAFNILKSKDLEHSNLYISSNCKEESVNLINMAKRLRFERMMQQLQILLIESR